MDISSKDIWRDTEKYCIICENECVGNGIQIMNNFICDRCLEKMNMIDINSDEYEVIKNKIKNNYMFLILILPLMQVFIFNKYILYLGKTNSINIDILFISTILFTIEILINIIVVNIALKSILAYDLKRKIYLTNLENDKNKYVKDIYMNQKTNFSNLLNGFKNEIKYLLNYSSLVKENQFKDKNVFSKNISNVIKDAEDLNKTIIDLLDKNRDSKNVNGGV